MQYNITFSVRFFCPRAISKLGDKTHPPGHIFFIIIFVLDIPAVSISKLDEIFDLGQTYKKLEINWHYLNPIPIFKDFISHSQGQIPVPVTPIPFSQAKNRPIPAPVLPLHDPLCTFAWRIQVSGRIQYYSFVEAHKFTWCFHKTKLVIMHSSVCKFSRKLSLKKPAAII